MEDDSSAAMLAALEGLEPVIEALSQPGADFNRALHEQHIALARTAGLEDQEQAARIGLVEKLACGEDVWLPLLADVQAQANLESEEDVQKLLALHELSVSDYLSIPLLASRAQFIIDLWNGVYPKPTSLSEGDEDSEPVGSPAPIQRIESTEVKELLTEDAVRDVLQDCALRANAHLARSHEVWDKLRDWELVLLETVHSKDVSNQLPHVHKLFLDRLRTPHATADDTFQAYTAFVSRYSESDYEQLLVAASKAKADGVGKWSKRERWEDQLAGDVQSRLAVYPNYIAWELKPKTPDVVRVRAVYARAIADAASSGEVAVLETFWLSYMTFLNKSMRIEKIMLPEVFRAVRSCPMSGEIWAWYIKSLERFFKSADEIDAIYRSALASQQLTLRDGGVEDLVKVVMARLSHERRRVEEAHAEDQTFVDLALEASEIVKSTVKGGDPNFRVEKYLVSWFERQGRTEEASTIWESLTKTHATSYLVWTGWGDFETRRPAIPRARNVYQSALAKPNALDWPEAVFSAFLAFEEMFGTLDTLEDARSLLEKAQGSVAAKRQMVAEQAAEEQAQYAAAYPAPEAAPAPPAESESMDVDAPEVAESSNAGQKRKADEELAEGGSKKAKPETSAVPAPQGRDREHTTVFVSNLAAETTEEDLADTFKDCGEIREIKIVRRSDGLTVGTVEFLKRDAVPAALTKDKKVVKEAEIEVSIAWHSTLYVTNFPETADDAFIRGLFEPYGPIYETRWPGKKFKVSRRFVYVQFLSPASAEASLELDGKELEPERALSVAISNPARKKERTDAKLSAKEVVVTQMSKFVDRKDLERLFQPFGEIKDIRMNLDNEGHVRGAAFVEFADESAAQAALSMSNHELKKRRIAVTMPDHRAKANTKFALEKTVRVGALPKGTQEALLQQAFEKATSGVVSRVSVHEKTLEALVELASEEAVGQVLLSHNPFDFDGVHLPLLPATQRFPTKAGRGGGNAGAGGLSSSSGTVGGGEGPPPSSTSLTPATLLRPAPRPKSKANRLGLKSRRSGGGAPSVPPGTTFVAAGAPAGGSEAAAAGASGKKGQDAFRAMLLEKKA